jgi:hypothetical protein
LFQLRESGLVVGRPFLRDRLTAVLGGICGFDGFGAVGGGCFDAGDSFYGIGVVRAVTLVVELVKTL